MNDLKGKVVKESKLIREDGIDTLTIEFEDGLILKAYPSLGHNLGVHTHDSNIIPWYEQGDSK